MRKLTVFVFLFSFLFITQNCLPAKNIPLNITFRLQPVREAKFSYNGENIESVKQKVTDKTMGEVVIDLPASKKKEFSISLDGYETLTIDLNEEKMPDFVALNKKGTHYPFLGAYKTGVEPKSVTFIDNERVVLPLLDDHDIRILNVKTGEQKSLPIPQEYAKKVGFVETLIRPDAREIWVSQMTLPGVHIFSLDDLSYQSTLRVKGVWSKVMLEDKKNNRVYLTNWVSHDVSVIDTSVKPYKEIARWKTKTSIPRGLALSADGNFLYIAEFGREGGGQKLGHILKLSTKTGKILSEFGPWGSKRHIEADEERSLLYVSDMRLARIEIYDIKTEKLVKTIKTYAKPNTIALSPDKTRLYVSCRGPNNPKSYRLKGFYFGQIQVIDTLAQEMIETWEAGNQPTGLGISPDGKTLATSDFLDQIIRVYGVR